MAVTLQVLLAMVSRMVRSHSHNRNRSITMVDLSIINRHRSHNTIISLVRRMLIRRRVRISMGMAIEKGCG